MRSFWPIALTSAIFVLFFDTAGALISLFTGFNYGWLAIGSLTLYGIFGFIAGRKSGWVYGPAIGAFLGLVDSTLGWTISWTIGPGKPSTETNALIIVATIVFVTLLASVLGLLGSLLSRLAKRDA